MPFFASRTFSHQPNTQERLDKAAATQMVFEDALIHIVDGFIRKTGSDRLVLTGGAALNAVANMRLLETFRRGLLRARPRAADAAAPVGSARSRRCRGDDRRRLRLRRRRRGRLRTAARACVLLRALLAHCPKSLPPLRAPPTSTG